MSALESTTPVTPVTHSPEWHEMRRQGIGSSDIAGIVGLSKWSSPYSVWADKVVAGADTSNPDNEDMEFGRRAEPMLAKWFEDRTGLYALGEQTYISRPDKPWMRASLDFFVGESPDSSIADALGGGEIKTTGDPAEQWEAEIPAYYMCQVQWQMAVSGFDRIWMPVLHMAFGRRRFRIHEVVRNDDDVTFLEAAGEKFWTKHVLTGKAPNIDGAPATRDALASQYPGEQGTIVELDEQRPLIEVWLREKAQVKQAEARLAETENRMRALLGDATEGTVQGFTVVSWRTQETARLDSKALRERLPKVANRFTKTSTSRVLRAHNPKGNPS
jgi:putative phage-type endonuclease